MPRGRNSCTAVQSTVDFPVRKTRSHGKIGAKEAVGLSSPRKRTQRVAGKLTRKLQHLGKSYTRKIELHLENKLLSLLTK